MTDIYTRSNKLTRWCQKMLHAVRCHSNVKLQVKVTQVQGYNVTHKSYNDVKG